MNQVRDRTTSRNPAIRLLLAGLAFILFNLYIANRQHFAICLKILTKPFSKFWLTLRRLARMLAHAVGIYLTWLTLFLPGKMWKGLTLSSRL